MYHSKITKKKRVKAMNVGDEMIGKNMMPEADKLMNNKNKIEWSYELSLAEQNAEICRKKIKQIEAECTKRIDDIKLKHEKEVKRLQAQVKINITEREYLQSLEIENSELQDAVIMLAKKLSQKDRVAELKQYLDEVTQNAKTREWTDDEW